MPSILEYLTLGGDQVVTVPDGTYTAGFVAADTTPAIKHPATEGRYGGMLILQAETPGGVRIVPTGTGATLDDHVLEMKGAERIVLLGFRTEAVVTRLYGCKSMWWWYPDCSYPLDEHPDYPENMALSGPTTPSTFIGGTWNGRNNNLIWAGASIHDVGDDGFRISGTDDALWQGCTWKNVAHHGYPHNQSDHFHNDCIQSTGDTLNLRVYDCHMVASNAGSNAGLMWIIEKDKNNISGEVQRLWHDGPGFGVPLQFHRRDTADAGSTVKVTLEDVWAWESVGTVTQSGSGVTLTQQNVTAAKPSGTDPATAWRTANPYESWRTYFGFDDEPIPPEPPVDDLETRVDDLEADVDALWRKVDDLQHRIEVAGTALLGPQTRRHES